MSKVKKCQKMDQKETLKRFFLMKEKKMSENDLAKVKKCQKMDQKMSEIFFQLKFFSLISMSFSEF